MILITIVHPMITNNRAGASIKVYSGINGILIFIVEAIPVVTITIIAFFAAMLGKGAVNMVRLLIADSLASWDLL